MSITFTKLASGWLIMDIDNNNHELCLLGNCARIPVVIILYNRIYILHNNVKHSWMCREVVTDCNGDMNC